MPAYKTLQDLPDINGKTVILRADLNVPTDGKEVTDMTRIDRVKPTIDALLEKGAKIKILSHFGRPKGQVNPDYSLEFLAPILSKAWDHDVAFDDENAQIILLENTRFHEGEEANDMALAKRWADLGDIYVNDAFSVSHRAHASTESIAKCLPSYAGLLMEQELTALEKALTTPERPVTAIVGGAKISTKLDLLNNLIKKVDHLILGGGMANTFVAAKGYDVGASLCENDMLDTARDIMDNADKNGCLIVLPTDFIVAKEFKAHAQSLNVLIEEVPADYMALDVGPKTIMRIEDIIQKSKTIVWNGPMGAFEIAPFDNATIEIAEYVANFTRLGDIVSVAGGGDTVSAMAHAGVKDDLSYLSSAGGAFLEWLEGKTLPGVAALSS